MCTFRNGAAASSSPASSRPTNCARHSVCEQPAPSPRIDTTASARRTARSYTRGMDPPVAFGALRLAALAVVAAAPGCTRPAFRTVPSARYGDVDVVVGERNEPVLGRTGDEPPFATPTGRLAIRTTDDTDGRAAEDMIWAIRAWMSDQDH